ncbi:hypothetical protein WJX81_000544 [Elliptochloris bilobata]|uniref:Uncharacterized protein n=1 Tax=Elliptochloris bilobata TaxID=381761 RepID=A0AAW1RIK4_9CHLO
MRGPRQASLPAHNRRDSEARKAEPGSAAQGAAWERTAAPQQQRSLLQDTALSALKAVRGSRPVGPAGPRLAGAPLPPLAASPAAPLAAPSGSTAAGALAGAGVDAGGAGLAYAMGLPAGASSSPGGAGPANQALAVAGSGLVGLAGPVNGLPPPALVDQVPGAVASALPAGDQVAGAAGTGAQQGASSGNLAASDAPGDRLAPLPPGDVYLDGGIYQGADGYTLWDDRPPGSLSPAGAPEPTGAHAPADSVDAVYQAVVGGLRPVGFSAARSHALGAPPLSPWGLLLALTPVALLLW